MYDGPSGSLQHVSPLPFNLHDDLLLSLLESSKAISSLGLYLPTAIHYCFTCHLLYFPALEIVYFPIILDSSRCFFLSLDSQSFLFHSFILSHLLYVNILKVLSVFNILAHTFNPTAQESEADRSPENSRSAGST